MPIKLNIPNQEKPTRDSFPTAPRKVRRWLSGLAAANLSDNTRELFRGLQQCNRLLIAAKDRLEIMELFRPPVRQVLRQLEKRYQGMSLPLPTKTRAVFDLNLTLLQSMATGYKCAVADAVNGNSRMNSKLQALATQRALRYSGEIMLRCSQAYLPLPQGLWQDIHRLYANIELQDRAHYTLKDPEINGPEKTSVLHCYKHLLLFSLAKPESLRRGESEKVYDALLGWADQCSIGAAPRQLPDFPVFVVDLTGYAGPTIPAYLRSGIGPSTRIIDVRQVLNLIRVRLRESSKEPDTLALDKSLAYTTLQRLETNIGLSAARNSKRTRREEEATVELGLRNIHLRVAAELEPEDEREDFGSNLTLQAIPPSERRAPGSDSGNYITHPSFRDMEDEPGVWDLVGSGNVLTKAYREELEKRANERYKVPPPPTKHEWKLLDVSAGGFGLRWQGAGSAKAHVGEVVGMREVQRGNYAQWRIGVIRWMRFTGTDSFEAGVQTLSPHGMAVMVERRHVTKGSPPRECLILPEIKAVGQSTSLLTPAHMYKVGETVKVKIFNKDMEVRLTNIVEHTGSFTQYQIISANLQAGASALQSEADADADRFANVWDDI